MWNNCCPIGWAKFSLWISSVFIPSEKEIFPIHPIRRKGMYLFLIYFSSSKHKLFALPKALQFLSCIEFSGSFQNYSIATSVHFWFLFSLVTSVYSLPFCVSSPKCLGKHQIRRIRKSQQNKPVAKFPAVVSYHMLKRAHEINI